MIMYRIVGVRVVRDYVVELTFDNGVKKTRDLAPLLSGPIFQPMLDSYEFFCKVYVDPEPGTIVWPNDADICPDLLYYNLEPA